MGLAHENAAEQGGAATGGADGGISRQVPVVKGQRRVPLTQERLEPVAQLPMPREEARARMDVLTAGVCCLVDVLLLVPETHPIRIHLDRVESDERIPKAAAFLLGDVRHVSPDAISRRHSLPPILDLAQPNWRNRPTGARNGFRATRAGADTPEALAAETDPPTGQAAQLPPARPRSRRCLPLERPARCAAPAGSGSGSVGCSATGLSLAHRRPTPCLLYTSDAADE